MIEQLIQDLAFSLEKFGTGAYLIVSLVVLLETIVVIGQFIPGSIFLILIGFLCYMRVFDFANMTTSVFLAHFGGELVNYALGRTRGRSLFREDSRFFKPRFLQMAEDRFRQTGARILFTGQFLGFLRPFISLAAGASHYNIWRFIAAIAPACLIWTILPLAIGFLGGASWQKAIGHMKDLSLILLIAIPLTFFSAWLIKRLVDLTGFLRPALVRLNTRIRSTAWYQRLASRNPRLFAFLENRISLSRPWGLNASVGFFSATLCLLFFCLILWDIHTSGGWFQFDVALVNLLAQIRNPTTDQIFLIITSLGTAPVVTIAILAITAACLWSRQHKSLFVIISSVVLSTGIGEILEKTYSRERPDELLRLIEGHGYSFPSGHATVAFALCGSLYYWLWNHPGLLRIRTTLAFLLLVCAFLVGFSRVYLGVHYPSDVIAGFCLGFAGVLFSATFAANWNRLGDVQRRADISALAVTFIYGLAAYGYSTYKSPSRATLTAQPVSQPQQLNQIIDNLPRRAETLFGKPYLPINIILNGQTTALTATLPLAKWEPVHPTDFFTHDLASPVFPAFVNGKPAALSYQRPGKGYRDVLRLWRTDAQTTAGEVWLGSIVRHHDHYVLRRVQTYRQSPDIDLAAQRLAHETAPLNPTWLQNYRPRGLYRWPITFFTHGQALLYE